MTAHDQYSRETTRELTPLDADFPSRLRDIPGCPRTLYVRGTLPDARMPTAAIIGARDATAQGLDLARTLGAVLARNGIGIVSGMAYGIDAAGHWGALDSGGKTFAVFGCGTDICYPPSHFRLYEEILRSNGGLLSELSPGTPPLGRHFASRNRIISGLSDVVIVVEAKLRSGTLITVGNALEQGKQVFAVPGRVTDRLSEGCNRLIRDGASILTSAQDILEYFHLEREREQRVLLPSSESLPETQRCVLEQLSSEAVHIEQLAAHTDLPAPLLSRTLLELELQELCESPKPGYYRRRLTEEMF